MGTTLRLVILYAFIYLARAEEEVVTPKNTEASETDTSTVPPEQEILRQPEETTPAGTNVFTDQQPAVETRPAAGVYTENQEQTSPEQRVPPPQQPYREENYGQRTIGGAPPPPPPPPRPPYGGAPPYPEAGQGSYPQGQGQGQGYYPPGGNTRRNPEGFYRGPAPYSPDGRGGYPDDRNNQFNAPPQDVGEPVPVQDDLPQYDRNRNIHIHDLPERTDENIPAVIAKLSELLRVPLEHSDIQAVYRIRTSPGKIRPLVIEFSDVVVRNDVLTAAKRIHLNTQMFYADEEMRPVYINEPLTRYFRKLLYETKKKAAEMGYKFCWYRNAKLHVRKDEFSNPIHIDNFEDITKIV